MSSPLDLGFAYDFNRDGKQDHLTFYRPGSELITILGRTVGTSNFVPAFNSSSGIGGFDLAGDNDVAFAYDCDHVGQDNCIVLYRSGTGAIFVITSN